MISGVSKAVCTCVQSVQKRSAAAGQKSLQSARSRSVAGISLSLYLYLSLSLSLSGEAWFQPRPRHDDARRRVPSAYLPARLALCSEMLGSGSPLTGSSRLALPPDDHFDEPALDSLLLFEAWHDSHRWDCLNLRSTPTQLPPCWSSQASWRHRWHMHTRQGAPGNHGTKADSRKRT